MKLKFYFIYFLNEFPRLIVKVPYTLVLGITAFLLALALGVILALAVQSRLSIVNGAARVYISFFRSTPYITQLFILYFGLPQIFYALRAMTAQTALILSISLNSAAFISEILRGGLLSVS